MHARKHICPALHWLLVLAVVLRGLIPAGYMPDAPHPGTLFPALAICSGHGPMHHPGDDSSAKNHDAACPFSVNAVFSFAGVQPPGFAALVAFFIALPVLAALALRPQRIYGNASPRSPPLLS